MVDGRGAAAAALARTIRVALDERRMNDPIRACPPSELKRLYEQPELVLQRTADEISAETDPNDQLCWLRLHEDATLALAAEMLNLRAINGSGATADWLGDVIWILDTGMVKSAAIERRRLFAKVFQELENMADGDSRETSSSFDISEPSQLITNHSVYVAEGQLTYEEFNDWLHGMRTPVVLQNITSHWPASQRWQDPGYWLHITLGGRRIVPVEIGESYMAADYRSEMMSFRKYHTRYVLPESPREMGYMAQHELFTQIPALESDIIIPDYCYTTPPFPDPDTAAALTSGLYEAPQLEVPQKNVWIGPRGTKTPLHTDPYHNILAQVVGYKYVRLYSPEQRPFLYPGTVDENGQDISNTSLVDISAIAVQAKYQECILKPGDCLYIPLGWWHFVESLSVSVSVSFWWN